MQIPLHSGTFSSIQPAQLWDAKPVVHLAEIKDLIYVIENFKSVSGRD